MKKLAISTIFVILLLSGCDTEKHPVTSDSGVQKATAKVEVQSNGLTTEQENIKRRVEEENKVGSIKHLYIISPYSGQVIMYSTVKGKVTSSGKSLTPKTVAALDGQYVSNSHSGFPVSIGGKSYYTSEALNETGTFGNSGEYLYWWDTKQVYHQHYVTSGQIIHVSDQPMAVKNITINMESVK